MRILAGVCMIMGCFLGAGFVSGREIASYFSRFGKYSGYGILVATIMLFLLILVFLFLSSKVHSCERFCEVYFGKWGKVIHFLMSICVLIMLGSMFAGTTSLGETFHINSTIFTLITFFLAYLIVSRNVGVLQNVNLFLIPFVLVVVIITIWGSLGKCSISGNMFFAIASGGNYVLINIVSLGMFLIEIGHKYSSKERYLIAIFSSLIIGVMLIFINNAILKNMVIDDVFPLLTMAKSSHILYVCMQIAIFFGLFTTLISNALIFCNYLQSIVHSRRLSCFLTLCLGLLLSIFGFSVIVGYIYWIIGLIGGVLLVGILLKEKGKGKPQAFKCKLLV